MRIKWLTIGVISGCAITIGFLVFAMLMYTLLIVAALLLVKGA